MLSLGYSFMKAVARYRRDIIALFNQTDGNKTGKQSPKSFWKLATGNFQKHAAFVRRADPCVILRLFIYESCCEDRRDITALFNQTDGNKTGKQSPKSFWKLETR